MADGKTESAGWPMDETPHAIGITGIISGIIGARSVARPRIIVPTIRRRHATIRINIGLNKITSLHDNHAPVARL